MLTRALAICLAIGVLAFELLQHLEIVGGRHIEINELMPERGSAYLGKLSDAALAHRDLQRGSLLYLIERKNVIRSFEPALGGLWAYQWLLALSESYPNIPTLKTRTPLGPSGAQLADIRDKGGGRYSIADGSVHFSLPRNEKLIPNMRVRLVTPYVSVAFDGRSTVGPTLYWIGLACAGVLILLLSWPLWFRATCWLVQNVVPGIAISAILLIAAAGLAEGYMRITGKFPKSQNSVTTGFTPGVGQLMPPHIDIKFTNGIDFWNVDKTNSLGFLDHEPALPKPAGTFRILLVGDSFIEALQVHVRAKIQTALSGLIRRNYPQAKIDVVAIGRSGIGQANELGVLEGYPQLKPDIVLLFFVSNDFANNSSLIESARAGYHPYHPPWLFFRRDERGACHRIPVDNNWWERRLTGVDVEARLKGLQALSPALARMPIDWPRGNVDGIFHHSGPLPPVFQEAVELTKCAFAEWKAIAAREEFKLVVVATDGVTRPGNVDLPGQIDRLRNILSELQIPLLDLYPEFTKRGEVGAGRFKWDGHWNKTGHRWAAEASFEYLRSGDHLRVLK